ncbi:P-loop NTPase fold protein [Cronobacter turicensis]|uniref:P-loop NTPase fold protein n=1 Tax=Cronobacter turicensis TaxID=413502 RepID=UPI0031F60619
MKNLQYFLEYIDYYKKIENPGYAVLVTGAWGSGKTYQIKKALSEDEMYYVSLFDLTSVDAIYSTVFYKMSPAKAIARDTAKGMSDASIGSEAFTFGLGGILGKVANAIIKEDVKKDRVIVFDDIERCSVDINEILGVINKYVEHHGCKVIAIAHDDEIEGAFDKAKEKVIGQTLRITPDTEEAYNYFLQEYDFGEPGQIAKEVIKRTFINSGCNSLRVLKYTLRDCFRLYSCLTQEHKANKIAMEDIFSFFSGLSISYRQGELKEEHLTSRINQEIKYHHKKDEQLKPLTLILHERYKENGILIDFSKPLLSDEILVDCLVKGYYHKEKIINHIDGSVHFAKKGRLQPWYYIINFDELPSNIVEDAIRDMDNAINEAEITNPGDIMHTFSLYLLMSSIGVIKASYAEIEYRAKNYFKKLLDINLLPPIEFNERYTPYRDAAHGYVYWVNEKYRNHFNEIFNMLDHYRELALKKKYSQFKEEILSALKGDVNKFVSLICRSHFGTGDYAYIEILKSIKPYLFVELWLENPHHSWRSIQTAVQERYSANALNNTLSGEKKWLKDVIWILNHQASKKSGFDKLRIERIIPQCTL